MNPIEGKPTSGNYSAPSSSSEQLEAHFLGKTVTQSQPTYLNLGFLRFKRLANKTSLEANTVYKVVLPTGIPYKLKTLPPYGLKAQNRLCIDHKNKEITCLPKHLTIDEGLILNECPKIKGPHKEPTSPEVGEQVSHVKPTSLEVGGKIFIQSCSALTELHMEIKAEDDISIHNCPISQPSMSIYTGQSIGFSNCSPLKTICTDLEAKDEINISNCPELEIASVNLKATRLTVSNCPRIKTLATNCTVSWGVYLYDCSAIEELPPKLNPKVLRISYCPSLKTLPANFSGGDLEITDCPKLKIPSQLKVKKLSIRKNPELISLPEGLVVTHLVIENCPNFTTLPPDLKVSGDIDLRGCINLKDLPESIKNLGASAEGGLRKVFLYNTGLLEATIHELQKSNSPEIEFVFTKSNDEAGVRRS